MLEGCLSMPCIKVSKSVAQQVRVLAAEQVSSSNYYDTSVCGVFPATYTQGEENYTSRIEGCQAPAEVRPRSCSKLLICLLGQAIAS